jgi:hypothetical protein
MKNKIRVVVCAANRSTKTGRIVCGARHWDNIMRQSVKSDMTVPGLPDEWKSAEQGFIDQYGVWMTREEAWEVALAADQIKYPLSHSEGTLYSENLY